MLYVHFLFYIFYIFSDVICSHVVSHLYNGVTSL